VVNIDVYILYYLNLRLLRNVYFLDLIGVCIEVGDVEVCSSSTSRTEIAKREIVLIDMSMATVSLYSIFFSHF